MSNTNPEFVSLFRREPSFSPGALLPPREVRRRMGWLVAAHLLVSPAPLLTGLLSSYDWAGYAAYVMSGFAVASVMLLAFWLGLGGGEFLLRLLLVSMSVLLFASWQVIPEMMQGRWRIGGWSILEFSMYVVGMWALFVGLVAAAFLVTRIWLVVVRPLEPDDHPPRNWIKFSMLHLIVAMTICAALFALVRAARSESPGAAGALVAAIALGIGYSALFANTLAAAFATLGRKPLAPRIAVTFVAAIALGLLLSLAAGHDDYGWGMIISEQLIFVISTAVIVGSLLVVRSCGYRLIRRPKRVLRPAVDWSEPPPRNEDAPLGDPHSPEPRHA